MRKIWYGQAMFHQTRLAGYFAGFGLVAFLIAILTGCSTTQKVDWDARIGTYTYDEALSDLGQPSEVKTLDGDVKSASWITPRGVDNSKDSMPPIYTREQIVTSEDTYGYEAPNKVLRLMFAPNGKLIDWQRNY